MIPFCLRRAAKAGGRSRVAGDKRVNNNRKGELIIIKK